MNSIPIEFRYEYIFRDTTDPGKLRGQAEGRPCKKDVNLVLRTVRVDPRGARLEG